MHIVAGNRIRKIISKNCDGEYSILEYIGGLDTSIYSYRKNCLYLAGIGSYMIFICDDKDKPLVVDISKFKRYFKVRSDISISDSCLNIMTTEERVEIKDQINDVISMLNDMSYICDDSNPISSSTLDSFCGLADKVSLDLELLICDVKNKLLNSLNNKEVL